MSGLLEWALGLERLSLGGEGVRFAFERGMPLYLWVGALMACAGAAALAYRKVGGPSLLRWSLAGVRAALLLALVALALGPSLERRDETTEPDWVLALVDRSESMTVRDVAGEGGGRLDRDAQLRAALEASAEAIAAMGEDREVRWFGFGDGAYELETDERGLPVLGPADGRRTAVGRSLSDALERAAARPVAGVLLLSDGRASDAPGRSDVRALASAGAPMHVTPLGSEGLVTDVSVAGVSAPAVAYEGDPAPVTVALESIGSEGAGGVVRLIDESSGEELARERVEIGAGEGNGRAEVTLTHTPKGSGSRGWRAEFVPDEPDLIAENNTGAAVIEIVNRPIRALYLDGYPRWEQRYLRNLLRREASVESSSLMLAPNRRYLQEGDVEIRSLPTSPEEWAEYDVVVLGDLDPGVLTVDQLDQLRLFVSESGGGLLWIGGESHTPRSWWSTPLAALIPFTAPRSGVETTRSAALASPTEEAERLGVLRLLGAGAGVWPPELSDPATGWSALQWAQRVEADRLKPSATALATAVGEGEPPFPLVTTMRYGAGRVLYVATDEIWRWRYGRGELYYERFWVQLLRLLGRERLISGDAGYELRASTDEAAVGEAVTVTVEIRDQSLLETAPETVRVRARAETGALGVEGETVIELRAGARSERGGRFTGVWSPPAAGRWRLETADAALRVEGGDAPGATVRATLPGGELNDPRPDHELLAALASMTGGEVIAPGDLSRVGEPGVFPSRRVRRVTIEREALWDTPLAIGLVILLAGAEWIGRRVMRLM